MPSRPPEQLAPLPTYLFAWKLECRKQVNVCLNFNSGYFLTAKLTTTGCQMVFFSNQISKIGYILDGHLEYFTAIWYIVWPFGIFYGYLVYFSRFGMLYQEKSGNTGQQTTSLLQCK
jgi:hypothetical protein